MADDRSTPNLSHKSHFNIVWLTLSIDVDRLGSTDLSAREAPDNVEQLRTISFAN